MYVKITNNKPLNFITLNDAKRQLNIYDDNDHDAHLGDLIYTAMELAEKATNRKLTTCTVTLITQSCDKIIKVPYGEVSAITSLKNGDTDVTFEFNPVKQQINVTDDTVTDDTELTVIYDAGYSDPNNIPSSIKMGAKILISDLFENRNSTVVGMSVNDIPMTAKALFDVEKLDYI